jgi:hypothetical protein
MCLLSRVSDVSLPHPCVNVEKVENPSRLRAVPHILRKGKQHGNHEQLANENWKMARGGKPDIASKSVFDMRKLILPCLSSNRRT